MARVYNGIVVEGSISGIGLTSRESVKLASVGNFNVSTVTAIGTNIDGIALADGDRFLLKNQTSTIENGVYVVNSDSTVQRAVDYEEGTQAGGTELVILQGVTLADSVWLCTNDPPNDVVDTNSLTFVRMSGSGANGDVSSSISSTTDNRIVRTDGTTGKIIQDSGIELDDSDNINNVTTLQMASGTGVRITASPQTSSEGTLNILNLAGGTQNIVGDTYSQTLTNKTINASNNTITNIADAEIAAGADINANKLGTGVISNVEFNNLNGTTSNIQTQLDDRVVGPGSSTDNRIPRYSGTTGKLIDESGVTINDTNNISGIVNQSMSGYIEFTQIATPATPAAGQSRLYFKTGDDGLYHLPSSGIEVDLTSIGALPTTTKGDIIVHNGITNVRLPVGADGEVLVANSTVTEGVEWSNSGISSQGDVTIFRDEKAAGVNGGTSVTGSWLTRDLNTTDGVTTGFSLASNQVTVPAGTWYVVASIPFHRAGVVKARLRNITDATTDLVSQPHQNRNVTSNIIGYITIASSKVYEIQYQCSTNRVDIGLGIAAGFGEIEVYTILTFTRRS